MDRQIAQLWQNGSAWRRPVGMSLVILGVIGLLFQSLMVVDATHFVNSSSTSSRATEAITDDAGVTVTSIGIRKNSSTIAAAGNTAPGVEATVTLSAVHNALVQNNYTYTFAVKETEVDSWSAGEELKVVVYGAYNGSTTSLLATLYVQQSKADDSKVEGVTATIDGGSSSSFPDSFDIIVTRQ